MRSGRTCSRSEGFCPSSNCSGRRARRPTSYVRPSGSCKRLWEGWRYDFPAARPVSPDLQVDGTLKACMVSTIVAAEVGFKDGRGSVKLLEEVPFVPMEQEAAAAAPTAWKPLLGSDGESQDVGGADVRPKAGSTAGLAKDEFGRWCMYSEGKKVGRLSVEGGVLLVYQSFSLRTILKNDLNFTWDAERRAWTKPVEDFLSLTGATTSNTEDIFRLLVQSYNKRITLQEKGQTVDPNEEQEAEAAVVGRQEVKVEEEEEKLHVYNSYQVKDELKALGFMFDSKRKSWCMQVSAALQVLDVTSPSQVDIDVIRQAAAASKSNPPSSFSSPGLSPISSIPLTPLVSSSPLTSAEFEATQRCRSARLTDPPLLRLERCRPMVRGCDDVALLMPVAGVGRKHARAVGARPDGMHDRGGCS
eukprot:747490-Hanusia_phi.AAC.5